MALREETRTRRPAPPRHRAPLRPAPPHSRPKLAAGQRHCLPPPASLPAPPCSRSGPLTEESPFRRGRSHSPAAGPCQERKGEGREAASLARSGPRGAIEQLLPEVWPECGHVAELRIIQRGYMMFPLHNNLSHSLCLLPTGWRGSQGPRGG
ncbi:uncharacterized protein LOC116275390 isoform X1 [Papio anubis]|uniref:uncharacterized protein LOC116275390 isoform X1 n=1 Tax=Papio anubis TaxID=9555 RepID=UPI0012AE6154|nr:uncharacterized protein LOC116275390 isoform X1 [Papio anubis]